MNLLSFFFLALLVFTNVFPCKWIIDSLFYGVWYVIYAQVYHHNNPTKNIKNSSYYMIQVGVIIEGPHLLLFVFILFIEPINNKGALSFKIHK